MNPVGPSGIGSRNSSLDSRAASFPGWERKQPTLAAAMLQLLRCNRRLPFLHGCRLGELFFSSTSDAALEARSSSNLHSWVDYLVKSCGLSRSEASKASEHLAHLKSTERPDTVLTFLRSRGFHDSHLKMIVSSNPCLLSFDAEKTLAPKFMSLSSIGFSDSDLIQIIIANPGILNLRFDRTLRPRLETWERLFGSREILVKHMKRKAWFLRYNIEKKLLPNLAFLRDECGISDKRTVFLVKKVPSFLLQKTEALRALVDRAENLGMPRDSRMFLWVLCVIYPLGEKKMESKMKLMTSLGWSESEFLSALRKLPTFLCLSAKELQRKMEFWVNVVGYTPSYIAHAPILLAYSMEKRILPRYHVMEVLKSNGLYSGNLKLITLLSFSDMKFEQMFVLKYKEKFPELLDILSCGSREISPQVLIS